MKNILFLLIALNLLTVGCGKTKKSIQNIPASKADEKIYDELTPSQVPSPNIEELKYVGAIIFEYGERESEKDVFRPKWRQFICLEKTDSKIQKKIDIDISKLGPTEYLWSFDTRGPDPYQLYNMESRLEHLVIDYTLNSASISKEHIENDDYLTGHFNIVFNSEKSIFVSTENGQLVDIDPESNSPFKFFENEYSDNNLYSSKRIESVDKKWALFQSFARYGKKISEHNENLKNDNSFDPIAECEKMDRSDFIQIGNDIQYKTSLIPKNAFDLN